MTYINMCIQLDKDAHFFLTMWLRLLLQYTRFSDNHKNDQVLHIVMHDMLRQ